jgi:hypothetical protein
MAGGDVIDDAGEDGIDKLLVVPDGGDAQDRLLMAVEGAHLRDRDIKFIPELGAQALYHPPLGLQAVGIWDH